MASPFSFHCMICFEEFNIVSRYPVVLPCGHTYVCNQCAERLEKCMECRTSLVQIIPRGGPAADAHNSDRNSRRWSSGRAVGTRSPGAPPQPPLKKRLPLPKNVVLMSLIEATELAAAENARAHSHRTSLDNSPGILMDAEEDEEEKIRTGTTLAIGECGTYAVAAKDGLEIYPSRPGSHEDVDDTDEEEVDTLVRFFHLDNKMEPLADGESKEPLDLAAINSLPPTKLNRGDRVQIVSTAQGWAKLARGYGYVKADRNALLKVGSSLDKACKLEALLRLLCARKREIRNEQSRVTNQFSLTMQELQTALMSEEDMTVVPAETLEDSDDSSTRVEIETSYLEQPMSQEVDRGERWEDSTPLKPRPMERPMTPPSAIESSGGFFCSTSDMFDAVIPMHSRQPATLPRPTRNPAIVEALAQTGSHGANESTPNGVSPAPSNASPSVLRAGAQALRELQSRSALGGIDFRTGMSGHSALTSASAHPHDYLEPRMGTVFRGFSNHGGLSLWKSGRSKHQGRLPPPNMPMFPATNALPDSENSSYRKPASAPSRP
eukprot:Nitzschia sp. Nitz4//scaffold2_size372955//121250//122964//NITZ4_000395-RA/size372955-snap-gene-0.73-mRNA-1//-1//CDS//3329546692//7938//frame0